MNEDDFDQRVANLRLFSSSSPRFLPRTRNSVAGIGRAGASGARGRSLWIGHLLFSVFKKTSRSHVTLLEMTMICPAQKFF